MTNLFRISSRKRGPTYKRRVVRLQIPQGQPFTKPAIPLRNILVGKISMIQRGSLATSPIRFSQRSSEVNSVFETCGISPKWLHRTPLMVSQLWFNYQLIHNKISRLGEIAFTLYTSVIMPLGSYTVRCHYNAVHFLQNPYIRQLIARPWGRDMRCLLWIQPLIYILPQFLQWCMQYHVILDRVITALDCMHKNVGWLFQASPLWLSYFAPSVISK